MIHHLSIPVKDPQRVAQVLAELTGGYAGPFMGPFPGAWVVYPEDRFGTGFEIYAEGTTLQQGPDGTMAQTVMAAPAQAHGFHALISVKVDRATIERIGAREGWRTQHFWRGPGNVKIFELYEFWVENQILLELVTEEMLASYVAIANGPAQRAMLAKRPPPR